MRLFGIRAEKSHSSYLIIYQSFKSIFSTENETMRLFLQKKLFHVSENYEPFKQKCLSFTYEKGYEYELLATKTIYANPPADGSSYDYTLIKVVSKMAKGYE